MKKNMKMRGMLPMAKMPMPSAISAALVAVLMGAGFGLTQIAHASEKGDVRKLKDQVSKIDDEIDDLEDSLEDVNDRFDDIESQEDALEEEEFSGNCQEICRATDASPCSHDDWKKAGLNESASNGRKKACVSLFESKAELSSSCTEVVQECGIVKWRVEIAHLKAEQRRLERLIDRKKAKLDELNGELLIAKRECVDCGLLNFSAGVQVGGGLWGASSGLNAAAGLAAGGYWGPDGYVAPNAGLGLNGGVGVYGPGFYAPFVGAPYYGPGMGPGLNLGLNTGFGPGFMPGMMPPMAMGPGLSAGFGPGFMPGMMPPMAMGPGLSAGFGPGYMPGMSTGMMPPMAMGPGLSAGFGPGYMPGMMPGMSTGMMPPMAMGPGMSSGFGPGYMPGMMPGMSTGMMPGMSAGFPGSMTGGYNTGYSQTAMLQSQAQMLGQNLDMQRLQLAQKNMMLAAQAGGGSSMSMGYPPGMGTSCLVPPYGYMGGYPMGMGMGMGGGFGAGIGIGFHL